jgi:hypothetical protein
VVKELLSIALLVLLTGWALVAAAWIRRRWSRAVRAIALLGMLAAYGAACVGIAELAQQGGWPNGMFTVLVGLALVPATALLLLVLAVYTAFLGKVPGETLLPPARRRRRIGALLTYGLLAAAAIGWWAFRAAKEGQRYHPPYPPPSGGVVDWTEADVEAGQADYRECAGRDVRALRPPVLACRQARFGCSRHVSWFEPVGARRLEGATLRVLEVRHVRVFGEADDPGPGFDFADVVVRGPSGESLHLFSEVATSEDEATLVAGDPMGDAVRRILTLKPMGTARQRWPGVSSLDAALHTEALAGLPPRPRAPSVETAPETDRVAVRRLLALLETDPGEGILAALGSADSLRYRELATATVEALLEVRPLPPRDGNSYEECVASVLGEIGDPVAEDVLVEIAADPRPANRRAAVRALGRLGSYRALPVLERASRQTDPAGATEALTAMCEVVGGASVEEIDLEAARAAVVADPTAAAGHLRYGALCCAAACPTADGCRVRLLREAVSQLETFLELAPGGGPRAAGALILLDGLERTHGI